MKSEEDDHHTVGTASDDEDDFFHMNERRPSEEEVSSHSARLDAIKTDDNVIDDTLSTTRDRLLLLRSSEN